jgi:hypothetical protein
VRTSPPADAARKVRFRLETASAGPRPCPRRRFASVPIAREAAAGPPVPTVGHATPMEIARHRRHARMAKSSMTEPAAAQAERSRTRAASACLRQRPCRRRPKRKRRRRRDPRRIRRRSRRPVSVSGSASALAAVVRAVEGLPVAEGRRAVKVQSRWDADI